MSNTPKKLDNEQAAAGFNKIEKSVETWASSKKGTEILKGTQVSAKAAADFVDSEVKIDPALLHKSVTL